METDAILHTALFSGILGFVAFCASYAYHVWRSRNAASRPAKLGSQGRWFRWSALSVVLGCVLLLVSAIWREVKPREGVLCGQGLYTVRAEKDLKLEYVTPAKAVAAGEVLARFCSPERRAELTEWELKGEILETQRKITELQPLAPDGELVRGYEKCVADQRQLLASLSYLIPEHAVVVREKLRDRLDKTERLNALNTRVDSTRRELEQARARLTLAEKHVVRVQGLAENQAAAQIEMDEHATGLSVAQAEVARQQAYLTDLEIERKHIQESLPLFAACTAQQADEISGEIVRVREQLATAGKELQASQERLTADRRRAELLKTQMLSQLALEIRQYEARRAGVQDVLIIKSPFKGVVAYADQAPGTALPAAPVVILTPEQGFRFRLRMTEAEVEPLAHAELVTLGLVAPVLQRRFPGKLVKWEKLPHEPGYCLAELACQPPPETIRELAAREWGTQDWLQAPTMKVRLLWRPPVHVLPLFYPALGMMAVGLIGMFAARLCTGARRSGLVEQSNDPLAAPTSPPARPSDFPSELVAPISAAELPLDAMAVESGATGRGLQILGLRLRESIKRQQIQPSLLQALEWALDRHQARAIQHLATGLDHDPDLPASLRSLLERPRSSSADGVVSQAGLQDEIAERLVRIVRAIAPALLIPPDAPAQDGRASRTRSAFGLPAGIPLRTCDLEGTCR